MPSNINLVKKNIFFAFLTTKEVGKDVLVADL